MICPQTCSAGHVDPAPLFPALQGGFHELHAFGALGQRPAVGFVLDHVANEVFPLNLEAVVVYLRVWNFLPLVEEIHHLLLVRVPHRAWRGDATLARHEERPATAEPWVPSTWKVTRSSRRTRVAHDMFICAITGSPLWPTSSAVA
jgi:hypothetical protein